MSSRFQVGLFSLAGALAIHLACSASGTSPASFAHADTPGAPAAPACTKWEVQAFQPSTIAATTVSYTDAQGKPQTASFRTFPTLSLADGWEPYASDLFGSVIARHCAQ
jgi:hypothetical protein